jgi:PAS domain S-box-containing protein
MAEAISKSSDELIRQIDNLRTRLAEAENKLAESESQLAEAEEVLRAIQSGEVDAVVVSGPQGDQVFTLEGAEYGYRALVEAMNEGAATLAVDGTVLYCNQRLSDLLGIPQEQVIGSPVANLVAPEAEATHIFEALLEQARSGKPSKTELNFRTGQNDSIPVYLSLREMKTVDPPALCMVVTDLTERKQRDELIAAGRLATSILESAAEAIAVCDEAGKIIRINTALEDLCGFNPLFQPFNAALPLEMNDGAAGKELFSIFDVLLRSGTLRAKEVHFRRKDGRSVSLLLTASQIKASFGVIGCVLTMTDITERKRAEEAVLRSEKLASVGRMASTIAHEINNPLETIGQAVYLALTDAGISDQGKSYLELAVQELERVTHITRQTLSFHRENNTPRLIDLRESVDSILKLFAARLKSRRIRVVKRYRDVARISSFGGEMQQVISNLLSNSMDATPNHGRIEFRLSPSFGRNGARLVRFTVADTGSGIPPERLEKIFEPFFTTKEVIGTGLGLWVTKQIIEKRGAKIWVRSKLGHGTVFSITFPAVEATTQSSQLGIES